MIKNELKQRHLELSKFYFVTASTQSKLEKCWHSEIKNQIAFSKGNIFIPYSVSNSFQALNVKDSF